MNILNPSENYINYRCYIYGLSGSGLVAAQEKFYKKNLKLTPEISRYFNWMVEQRNNFSLPVERIEVREMDGKKHGKVESMMIYDIEYYIEGGIIKQKKLYIPAEKAPIKEIDLKRRASGERDPGEEG